jgi:diguanylate cyclase (GGDEF)-like protein
MSDPVVSELARVCANRFVSVGDAVRSLLAFLHEELPGGRVIFGELNYNTDEYRVLDALGTGVDALSAGARLPLRDSFCIHMSNDAAPPLTGSASEDPVYSTLELCRTAGIESYVAAPLERADGTRVASVCAMSSEPDQYGEEHRELLMIAARLIAYEWEHVQREGELRRLSQLQRDATSDPLTGLQLRDPFLDKLDREWHLTERGITESYLLAVQPLGIDAVRATSGDAVADLLLKGCGEVIGAAVRRSDIAARVADDVFGIILVGCKGIEGAMAFRSRLEASFERVMSQRPEDVQLIAGIEKLGEAESPAEALQRAEEALGPEPVGAAG